MPRIPLRDIPNAPGVVAQPTPNMPRVNLGAAQSLLQQPTISPDAFSGPAKGAQALAAGIGSVAGAADKFQKAAKVLQDQVDKNYLFRGVTAITEAGQAAQLEIEQNPTDFARYGEIVHQHLDQAREGFFQANPDMTPRAREMFEQEFAARRVDLYGRAQLAGVRQVTEENKRHLMGTASALSESGEHRMAIDFLEEQRGGGLFTDTEIDEGVRKLRVAADEYAIDSALLSNPEEAQVLAENERATPHLNPALRLRKIGQARSKVEEIYGQRLEDALLRIDGGEFRTEQELRKQYGDAFFIRYRGPLSKAIQGEFQFDPGAYMSVLSEISSSTPEQDTEKRIYQKQLLRNKALSMVPPGYREDMLQFLDEHFDAKPSAVLRSGVFGNIDTMLKRGAFGAFDKKDVDKGDREEIEKYDKAATRAYELKVELDRWMKDNPKATGDEVRSWMQQHALDRGWIEQQPKKRGWFDWFRSSDNDAPFQNAPAEGGGNRFRDGGEGFGASQGAISLPQGHKITSYGFAADRWKDSNSMKGIGAWDNQLEDKLSFAASPDVEKMLRESGVKRGGMVEITLDNGETVRVRWDDRTAGDKVAANLGLKPLRGRWDIYSKDGLHPMNGVAVTSFRKVDADA